MGVRRAPMSIIGREPCHKRSPKGPQAPKRPVTYMRQKSSSDWCFYVLAQKKVFFKIIKKYFNKSLETIKALKTLNN